MKSGGFRYAKLTCVTLTFIIFLSTIPSITAITSSQPTKSSIDVKVDKPAYERGDVITVSGYVQSSVYNIPLTVTVIAPDRNLVYIAQVYVSKDGTFSLPVKVEGPLWRTSGMYTISVQYGFAHISSQTTFEFEEQNIPTVDTFNVKDHTSGQNFNLNYTIVGGTIKDVSIEPRDLSLIVEINSITNGMVSLQIPRLLIDSKTGSNQDEPFIVLIDDEEITLPMEEPSDLNYRVLKIPFSKGDYRIDLIGTTIIPEFSGIINIVFVIAFAASTVFIMLVNMKLDRKLWIT